jgi:hypothetical protein
MITSTFLSHQLCVHPTSHITLSLLKRSFPWYHTEQLYNLPDATDLPSTQMFPFVSKLILNILATEILSTGYNTWYCFSADKVDLKGREGGLVRTSVSCDILHSFQALLSVLHGSQGIRDHFAWDPWIQFCNGYFEVYLFFN